MLEYFDLRAPYDFHLMLQRPLSRPSKLVAIDAVHASYSRVLRVGTRVIPITVTSLGTVHTPRLSLEVPNGLSEMEQSQVRADIRFMFSMEHNLNNFIQQMSEISVWVSLLHRLQGLRPIHDADLFESMVKVIIGQQLNLKFAATLVERLVYLGNETVEWKGHSLPAFPSTEKVAGLSYETLRALSFSQRKAEYVIDFAREVVEGRVDFDKLWKMTDEEVFTVLMPLRGIGQWTVECFLLFGMGRLDLMPAADIGVQNAVQKLYSLAQRPSAEAVRLLAESWKPWRSLATYYLWQSLVVAPTGASRVARQGSQPPNASSMSMGF
ncbi:DNA-3-methyladenine glycosylase 2 family protein [Alicyclobacillaceae bacterium I2511]|nr:DNA-3-methyladenine glycosylase 2 family protein [Alicyclobacillaceae bacterium I2511]